uniref:Sprouty related EVH1 domain containing 2 n=1 Tax=Amphiprion percula TaxID=161767 RepID=A0A3P8RPC7_AMPPE
MSWYFLHLASLAGDSYIVRVKAVVMTRDDSSGGWLAQDGGALSRVGVCRLLPTELAALSGSGGSQFLIRGERLQDKQVILDCPLRKDLVYTIAMPTFHHWKVEDRRCGLSFQSPADARAFDRGVRKAIEDLAEGSTTSSTALQNEGELGDDDVFTVSTFLSFINMLLSLLGYRGDSFLLRFNSLTENKASGFGGMKCTR